MSQSSLSPPIDFEKVVQNELSKLKEGEVYVEVSPEEFEQWRLAMFCRPPCYEEFDEPCGVAFFKVGVQLLDVIRSRLPGLHKAPNKMDIFRKIAIEAGGFKSGTNMLRREPLRTIELYIKFGYDYETPNDDESLNDDEMVNEDETVNDDETLKVNKTLKVNETLHLEISIEIIKPETVEESENVEEYETVGESESVEESETAKNSKTVIRFRAHDGSDHLILEEDYPFPNYQHWKYYQRIPDALQAGGELIGGPITCEGRIVTEYLRSNTAHHLIEGPGSPTSE